MYIWSFHWLWIRLRLAIDLSSKEISIWLLPTLLLTVITKIKYVNIQASWLVFHVGINLQHQNILMRDEKGEVVGKKLYPTFMIETIHS